jgi:hypothetical protein
MDQIITLTIIKALVMESVKNETYKRGQFDKALDPKNMAAAYHEQAGDEAYHERILQRSLYSSVEEFKSHLYDYIVADGFSSADNSITSSDDGTNIIITLNVSERFNKSYTQTLARVGAEYITNDMLFLWWTPINEKQASFYAQLVERNLAAIKRCFNKTAPTAPTYQYPTTLEVNGSSIDIGKGEEHTVTYEISDGSIDDIEVRVEDTKLIGVGRTKEGFTIIGKQLGHTYIQLYSRHDQQLAQTVHVYVTDQA